VIFPLFPFFPIGEENLLQSSVLSFGRMDPFPELQVDSSPSQTGVSEAFSIFKSTKVSSFPLFVAFEDPPVLWALRFSSSSPLFLSRLIQRILFYRRTLSSPCGQANGRFSPPSPQSDLLFISSRPSPLPPPLCCFFSLEIETTISLLCC